MERVRPKVTLVDGQEVVLQVGHLETLQLTNDKPSQRSCDMDTFGGSEKCKEMHYEIRLPEDRPGEQIPLPPTLHRRKYTLL